MKKAIAVPVLSTCLSFVAGIAVAQRVHDWHDLEAVVILTSALRKKLTIDLTMPKFQSDLTFS